jgi:polyisoprenoid-binding protein YceI
MSAEPVSRNGRDPMTTWRTLAGCVACIAAAVVSSAAGRAARSYTIDSGQSRATIDVGKSGAFSFAAGHTHEVAVSTVAGTIAVDREEPARSSVRLTIDAAALRVTGKGESADDVPKVQQTMAGPQVLDVQRYPAITFTSTSVAMTARTEASFDAAVTGQLTLHGVTRSISVPVTVRTDDATLTATGHFEVKQTDYGIKPISIGGVVSVKNSVNVGFTIVGR